MRASAIGFLGLRSIGLPIAEALRRSGHNVEAFDHLPAAPASFVATGGDVAETLDDAVTGIDLVITMLPDGAAVAKALTTDNGLARPSSVGSVSI